MSASAFMQKGETDRMEEVIPGPFPQLDWSQPMDLNRGTCYPPLNCASAKHSVGIRAKRLGAKRSKPRILKKKIKKKWSNKNHPDELTAREVNTLTCEATMETQISVGSLHDSNVENMNHIFLNKYNHITSEEIGEIGKRLGVQSNEDDRSVIQHITDLED
ncbi:hypothetical protein Ancab_016882 [Ancistrocladus abbreviatus]